MSGVETARRSVVQRRIDGAQTALPLIFVPKSISTRAREFIGVSHALHDIRIFIDAPLNFPARVELLNNFLKLLRPTHHTPGIKPGGRIEVCDYSTSSVSATLVTLPRF